MKRGGSVIAGAGFTIVEVMIVLAITGLMFVSAALLINGRQNRTEFQTAINSLQQQLQQIINETESGYYPNSDNFSCTSSANGTAPVISSLGVHNQQGTNDGCIFLGKVIYFGPGTTGAADTDKTNFIVLPTAANRLYNGEPVATLAQAWPVAISKGSSGSNPANVNAPSGNYQTYPLGYDLTFKWGNGPDPGNPFALGVFSSVGPVLAGGGYGSASAGISGASQYNLYGYGGNWTSPAPATPGDVVDKIYTNHANIGQLSSSIDLCVASASVNRSGKFTFTPGLAVSLQVFSDDQNCGE